MSAAVIVQTLFPTPSTPRAARRTPSGKRLSHLVAVGCALVPLFAMGQALALGPY